VKLLLWMVMAFGLGMVVMKAMPVSAAEMPACVDSERGNAAKAQAWWDRRSPQEQKYISELPCEERYIPMVCIFLWVPDLQSCVNKRVGNFRASKYCDQQGFELLSEEHVACQKKWIREKYKEPFPNASS